MKRQLSNTKYGLKFAMGCLTGFRRHALASCLDRAQWDWA